MDETAGGVQGRWRYRFGREVHGPYGFDELRVMAAQGRLPRHAGVAPEGSEDWREASSMPALMDAFDNPALAARGIPADGRAAGGVRPASGVPATEPPPAGRGLGSVPSWPPATAAVPPERDARMAAAEPSTERTLAHVVYGLYALNFFVGFTGLIGVVIAYVKRGSVAGHWLGTHFNWQIRSFWYGLGVAVIALLLARFLGWLVILAGAIWLIYRIVVGWRALAARQPIGDVDPIDNFLREQFRKLTGSFASRS